MLAIKATHLLGSSVRQVSQSRRLISGDVQSKATGVKMDSKSTTDSRMPKDGAKSGNFTKEETEVFQHPVRSAIDSVAEKIESSGAEASKSFTASSDLTNKAAHFTSRSTTERAAHTAEGLRESAAEVGGMSKVGQRIAKYASSGAAFTSAVGDASNTSERLEYKERPKIYIDDDQEPTVMDAVKNMAKHGMESVTESMSHMGQNLAEKVNKGKENTDVVSSMADPLSPIKNAAESIKSHMPSKDSLPSVDQVKETVKNAADSIKNSIPSTDDLKKSAENLMHKVSDSMPDAVKGMASTVKDSMPSTQDVKNTAQGMTNSVKDSMPSTGSVKNAANSVKDSMPSMDSVKGAANSVKDSMPSTQDVKNTAQNMTNTVKDSMPSMDSVKGMAQDMKNSAQTVTNTVKDSMPSTGDIKQSVQSLKDNISTKADDAKEMAKSATESASGVFDSFKQGISQMKEAMKPIVDSASEKIKYGAEVAAEKIPPIAQSIKENIKTGAAVAAEKIPPIAQSMKEKATDAMKSDTAESIKETVTGTAKGAFGMAKDAASSVWNGPKDSEKMNIKENTKTVKREDLSKVQAKDQAMSSSDSSK